MRIAMIGAGYVGLVSGACFSEFGFNVACVDRDKERIEHLTEGDIPIFEPRLESLILKNLDKHIFYTGSFMAKRIKKNWSNSSSQFIKIIPKLF